MRAENFIALIGAFERDRELETTFPVPQGTDFSFVVSSVWDLSLKAVMSSLIEKTTLSLELWGPSCRMFGFWPPADPCQP